MESVQLKRRSRRVDISKDVVITCKKMVKGSMVNLSKTGVLLELPRIKNGVEVGEQYKMLFSGAGSVSIVCKWKKDADGFLEHVGCEVTSFDKKWFSFLSKEYYKILYAQ